MRTGTSLIDTLGSPYGSDNPSTIGFIGAVDIRNESMMYSDNVSSRTLRDAKGVKFESNLPLF